METALSPTFSSILSMPRPLPISAREPFWVSTLSFVLIAFWTLAPGARPAPAAGCHDLGVSALGRAVAGQKVTAKGLQHCRTDLSRPPAGSGNWPIQIESALYFSGDSAAGRKLLPWLRGGQVWGHNGREQGSIIYESWNWASALAVHHRARQVGDAEIREASRLWLRAMLAKLALSASTTSPSQVRFGQGGEWYQRSRVNYFNYQGPFVHLVGDRSQEKPSRGKFTGSWVEVNRRHAALAWAIDWPGRRHKAGFAQKAEPASLVLYVVARLSGVSDFTRPVDPQIFGITEWERGFVRSFLEQPTNPETALRIASALEGYPRPNPGAIVFRRYANGKILTTLEATRNANKSGVVVAAWDGRQSIYIAPSPYKGVGAASASAVIKGSKAIARSRSGQVMELQIGDWGPLAWELRWGSDGVKLVEPRRYR